MKDTKLYIVVPCYNEQEVLPETSKRLNAFLDSAISQGLVSDKSRVLFVNDGSRDNTWPMIKQLSSENPRFEGICLAHNAGHQNALWAGMEAAKDRCDALISIDADLQDDISAMFGFLKEFDAGADIVYGVRSKRDTDTLFKRVTAEGFYRLMDLMGVETVFNHADYRLMSKRAVKQLLSYPEVNLFLRGMVPTLGYKTASVTYERSERFAGESKYPLKKMLSFALQGITSFSIKPLRLIAAAGILSIVLSLFVAVFGAGFTAFSVWFMGGMILTALGLAGEYIGRIYTEVKKRPLYAVMETVMQEPKE